jgi:hypothetical protein
MILVAREVKGAPADDYPSKKDLAKVIRASVIACSSGVAASGAALVTQGKTFSLLRLSLLLSPRLLF